MPKSTGPHGHRWGPPSSQSRRGIGNRGVQDALYADGSGREPASGGVRAGSGGGAGHFLNSDAAWIWGGVPAEA